MHCIATNVHRFFSRHFVTTFYYTFKDLGHTVNKFNFPLNQNINSHVIPAYSFYFYAVFLGYFYLFIFWPCRMALQVLAPDQELGLCRAPPGKSHLRYYFLLLILFLYYNIQATFSNFHKMRYVLWLFHLLRIFFLSGFPDG